MLSDFNNGKPYRDAQDRLLWGDKTCPPHTQLIMSWKANSLLLLLLTLTIKGHQGKKLYLRDPAARAQVPWNVGIPESCHPQHWAGAAHLFLLLLCPLCAGWSAAGACGQRPCLKEGVRLYNSPSTLRHICESLSQGSQMTQCKQYQMLTVPWLCPTWSGSEFVDEWLKLMLAVFECRSRRLGRLLVNYDKHFMVSIATPHPMSQSRWYKTGVLWLVAVIRHRVVLSLRSMSCLTSLFLSFDNWHCFHECAGF